MFTPLAYDSGKVMTIKDGTATSTTITKFDALDWSSGYLQRATSGTTEVRLVALEDVTTGGSGAHEDIQVLLTDGVLFEASTTHNTNANQRGYYADLTDHTTLDNDASSNDVFYIVEVIGAVADKKVRGFFVHNIS